MKKIIFNFIIIIWLIFASLLVVIDLYNRRVAKEHLLPCFSQIINSLILEKAEWFKNICYNEKEERFLTNGPYIPLSPGEYQVQFFLKGQGKIFVDVVSKGGKIVFASKIIEFNHHVYTPEYLDFSVGGEQSFWTKDLEFRVYYLQGEVCLEKIVLETKKRHLLDIFEGLWHFSFSWYKNTQIHR